MNEREAEKLRETVTQTSTSTADTARDKDSNWSAEELQLLVKAVNLFPAGTIKRWETVASYINTHAADEESREKDSKMVISKVKNLQRLEAAEQKESLNKQGAFSRFEQQHLAKDKGRGPTLAEQPQATPSERYGTGFSVAALCIV